MGAGKSDLPEQLTLEVSRDGTEFEGKSVATRDFSNALRGLAETYPVLRLPAEHIEKPYTLLLSNMLVDEGFRFEGGSTYRRD